MLDLGKNARTAAHSVGTLDTKIKNDILFDASENLMKIMKKERKLNRLSDVS